MDLPVVFQDVARELSETGSEGKDAGKHMDIERRPPPGDVDIILFKWEEMDVCPETGIVNDHTQH